MITPIELVIGSTLIKQKSIAFPFDLRGLDFPVPLSQPPQYGLYEGTGLFSAALSSIIDLANILGERALSTGRYSRMTVPNRFFGLARMSPADLSISALNP